MGDIYTILQGAQNHQNDRGYQLQILNNFQQLHDAVEKENNTIYSTYYQDFTFNSANSRQSKYVYQSTGILNTVNTWGFWIYIALAIVLSALVVRKEMSIYAKIALVVAILAYPFYIYPLEELTYVLSVYIWNLVTSVTYDNGYKNTSLEYGIASGEKLSGPHVSEKASDVIGGASYITNVNGGGSSGSGGANGNLPPLSVLPSTRPDAPGLPTPNIEVGSSDNPLSTSTPSPFAPEPDDIVPIGDADAAPTDTPADTAAATTAAATTAAATTAAATTAKK